MKITTVMNIQAPAADVWDVVGVRFATISEWVGAILDSRMEGPPREGAIRHCDLAAFGPMPATTLREELTLFDPGERALAYSVLDGMPGMVRTASNHWTIRATGPRSCVVQSVATIEVAWWALPMVPMMRRQTARDLKRALEQLRDHVEGAPVQLSQVPA
jgi:hypothetical protein